MADSDDAHALRELCLSAFDASEAAEVAQLATGLLDDTSEPGNLSLIAEAEGRVVGQVAFSPLSFGGTVTISAFILGPLSVAPGRQRSGIGSRLVREGCRQLAERGVELLVVYGDPDYYTRFGFAAELAQACVPPFPLQYPHGWLAMALRPHQPVPPDTRVACVAALNRPELW